MTNPLLERRREAPSFYVPPTPEADAAMRNQRLAERDPAKAREIEWFVAQGGQVMLRHRQAFSVELTEVLERKAESERQRFNHRQAYPVKEGVE